MSAAVSIAMHRYGSSNAAKTGSWPLRIPLPEMSLSSGSEKYHAVESDRRASETPQGAFGNLGSLAASRVASWVASCIVGSNHGLNPPTEVTLMKRFSRYHPGEKISPGRSRWTVLSRAGVLACALACTPGCARRTPTIVQPPPPKAVIERVTDSRNVFLSNAGANDYFNGQIPGAPNVICNELYAALQQWGYFHLVDSPDHADLIFQIRGIEAMPEIITPAYGWSTGRQHQPYLQLIILDPGKDQANPTPIDRITVRAGRGANIPKGKIALAQSIEWLTYQISTRVSRPPARSTGLNPNTALRPSFETLLRATGPIPPQFFNARKVYLEAGWPETTPTSIRNIDLKDLQADLSAWGYYQLVQTPQAADIVFHLNNDPENGVSITVTLPNSRVILWSIDDPRFGFDNSMSKVDKNLVSLLKQIHHLPLTRVETAALR